VDVLSQKFEQYRREFTNDDNNNNIHLIMIEIIAGDFNSPPGSATYNAMVSSGFVDVRTLSTELIPLTDCSSTTNDWYYANDEMIDNLWLYSGNDRGVANNKMNVLSVTHLIVPCCTVGVHDSMNRTASDHLMILTDISYL
jgi:hypothetical protein